MSIQRPDRVPAGPTDGRIFNELSTVEFALQWYPNFKHVAFRLLMIRLNRWYGSLLEIHVGERGKGFEFDYFDILFLRYYLEKLKTWRKQKKMETQSKPKTQSKILATILMPWYMIDNAVKEFVNLDLWDRIDDALPSAAKITDSQRNHPVSNKTDQAPQPTDTSW